MPTKDHHVILRSRIEVAIDADNHNKAARHAIHKAIEQRLIPILSKIFSAYVPSDVVIHLDKLVIDGGHFNLSTLSKQLPYEIEKRLTLTLKKEINKAIHQPKTDQVIPLPEAKQEAVAHYLSEGNFAWWMVENSEKQIEKIYLDLLEQSPLLIEQLWFNLHKKEKAVQRCLALFSRTTVERTLACLLKKPIASFTPILTEMGLLLQQTGILTGSRYTPEQPLLEMALLGAINQQRCTVEPIGFLHMLLKQVAMKTSVSYQQILEKLHAHYANNPSKSLSNQATKGLVQPLHDMAVMPPKFLNKNIDNKSKIIKLLDQVGNTLMASYQRSAVIRRIKAEMDKPGIRPLVKSWISEEKNRLALAKRLPYPLFVSLLQSVDPSITVYYQAHANQVQSITHLSNTEDEQAPVNEPLPAIERSLPKQIPLSKKLLDKLEMANVLWDQLIDNMDNTAAPVETCPRKEVIANQLHLSDVVDFLLYNELPNDQLVPAYLVAKVVGEATCGQIRDQLALLCQEVAILKKLIQCATEATLGKLFQAFVPFSNQLLEHLEKVIIQSKVLCNRASQADFLSIKALLITAALTHRPPTTEKQYIARIVLHLSRELSVRPTILSGQLMDAAGQITDCPLIEAFAQLKEAFAPLHLDKIDNVDLIFLSTQEKMRLDKLLLPTYFNQLLPAIKDMVRQSDSADLQLSVIYNLVLQHLPTLSGALQKTISATLHKQITTLLQSKKERVAERWHLFLHTGKLGNYTDNAALLDDVILHLPTFPLSWHKQHVRERLIANFTHAQLILLVERHSHAGQALANAIQATYPLWCATQGALEQPSSTKALFWDSVLKTFPQTAIATHFTHSTQDWLEEIITTLSNVLEIPSMTLLQTFQLLSQDNKEPSGATNLASSLNALQEKHQQKLQQQAIQCGSKSPFLTKLYLLLNGNLSLFSQRYHMPVTTLERELVQFMKAQPLELVQFLEEQANDPLVVRRIVYYFSQEVTTQIIAHLAKGHAVFVRHYLGLLGGHPLQYGSMQPHHLSMWQKELSISVINYLITHSQFKEIECVERTLLTTSFPKEELCKIIASIIAIRPMTQEEERIIKLLKPLVKRFTNPLINPSMLANNAFNDLPIAIEKKPSKKARPSEKAVRVYTQNGGLVFLWPFLYDFFSAHNLMTGNQFVSEQAAHNGVYLLQHLLTGKLTSPEWQLTLPKLLCGLSYDEVLLSYRPIDETYDASLQAQAMATISANRSQQGSTKKIGEGEMLSNNVIESNKELLFEKVINRWESLKKLKAVVLYQEATLQDILKSYCLNRLGILTRHQVSDGDRERLLWHLMIIHQDYDHLDLLPPWSLNSLKLPWMEEEILLFRDA